MKEYEREQLIIELSELQSAINVMIWGLDAVNDQNAVGCMNLVQHRLEEIIRKLSEVIPEIETE